MKVLVSGVPNEGIEVLEDALKQAYGAVAGNIELVQPSKTSLEVEVRQAATRANVLLVVLDSLSADICKESGRETLNSDKFVKFLNMDSFVTALESHFSDIQLQKPNNTPSLPDNDFSVEEESAASNEIQEGIIASLHNRIAELEQLLQYGAGDESYVSSNEDFPAVSDEVERLRSKISELEKELAHWRAKGTFQIQEDEKSHKLLKESDNFLRAEREKNALLEQRISALEAERGVLLKSAKLEVAPLQEEIALLQQEIEKVRKETAQKESKRFAIEKEELVRELKDANSFLKQSNETVSLLEEKVADLEQRLTTTSNSLFEANQRVVELSSEVAVGRFSSGSKSAQEKDYADLFNKYLSIQKDPLYEIGNNSYPQSLVSPPLIRPIPGSNILSVVAGSIEAHRLVYKFLRKELSDLVSGLPTISQSSLVRRIDPRRETVIVDLATESMLDYVFEVKKPVPGLNWFFEGGEIDSFLSKTNLRGVYSLSLGNIFVNDSSLFYVDWSKKLVELNKTGKNIIVVLDNLSSLVGRVLFENLRSIGQTSVVVDGMPTNVRNAIVNSIGLTVAESEALVVKAHPASKELIQHMQSRFQQIIKVDI